MVLFKLQESFQKLDISNQVDELGSVVVVAAELKDPTTREGKKEPVIPRPAPPSTALRSVLFSFSKFLIFGGSNIIRSSGLTVPDSGSGRSSLRDSDTRFTITIIITANLKTQYFYYQIQNLPLWKTPAQVTK